MRLTMTLRVNVFGESPAELSSVTRVGTANSLYHEIYDNVWHSQETPASAKSSPCL